MKNKQIQKSNPEHEAEPGDLLSVLILFDIDGTMTDSKAVDDQCFIETLEELYGFELSTINWTDFEHVTDVGLSDGIYNKFNGRSIPKSELKRVQRLFYKKLSKAASDQPECMKPVDGLQAFMKLLNRQQIPVAIATGGWRKTAELKLNTAQITYDGFTMATSNDSHKRRTIMNVAIARAQFEYQRKFSKIIYFGDGVWDAETCHAMQIPMIGIDCDRSGRLNHAPINYIFNDYRNTTLIFDAIEEII